MPMQKYIRALCHEHHVEMRHKQVLLKMQAEFKQFLTYVCPESGCAVHYNSSEGYFLTTPDGGQIEWDATRRVRCLRDGSPMYLAAVPKRDLRYWRCPQCDTSRTNNDDLLNASSALS